MDWKQLLAYITGSVDQELLLRNEYLITENRILRQQIPGRVRLGDEERKTLAEISKKLGKQALDEVATIVKPETILAWHRRFVAKKFDGSKQQGSRPPEDRPGAGDASGTAGPGESLLGVQPHSRGSETLGLYHQ
jgi:putative transposase